MLYMCFRAHLMGFCCCLGMMPSPELTRDSNVVYVTFNYRLGALGFLAVDVTDPDTNEPIRGNFGLLDQHAAMVWVKENVHLFGGNPDSVSDVKVTPSLFCAVILFLLRPRNYILIALKHVVLTSLYLHEIALFPCLRSRQDCPAYDT